MRSKYSPTARNTSASSSIRSTLSGMTPPERRRAGIHDHPQRARQEAGLERRVARQLAVELHRPGRAPQHPHPHDTAAPAPPPPRPLARPPQQLEENAEAFERPLRPGEQHVEP